MPCKITRVFPLSVNYEASKCFRSTEIPSREATALQFFLLPRFISQSNVSSLPLPFPSLDSTNVTRHAIKGIRRIDTWLLEAGYIAAHHLTC